MLSRIWWWERFASKNKLKKSFTPPNILVTNIFVSIPILLPPPSPPSPFSFSHPYVFTQKRERNGTLLGGSYTCICTRSFKQVQIYSHLLNLYNKHLSIDFDAISKEKKSFFELRRKISVTQNQQVKFKPIWRIYLQLLWPLP